MKKIVLFAAAGLMSLAACQEKAGYIIKGTAEGVADGDTVFLQKQTEEGFEALDSVVVKNGTFEFKGTPDSVAVFQLQSFFVSESQVYKIPISRYCMPCRNFSFLYIRILK